MKKLIFIFTLALISAGYSEAQSKSDKMYDVFANKDGITSLSFSKNMVNAINIDLDNNNEEGKKVTGNLQQIRFMSYNPKKGDLSGHKFIEKAIGYLPKTTYRRYEDKEDDNNTEIWLLGGKKNFSECHFFVKNENDNQIQFIVSFYGDFKVSDLNKLKKTGKEFMEN